MSELILSPKLDIKTRTTRWYRLIYILVWIFTRAKNFPVYHGRENIPAADGMLICANHTVFLDPMLLMVALTRRRQAHFMAKAEWFENKLFKFVLNKMGMFPVKRGESDMKAVKTALGYLKNGENVAIFPQGTRSDDDERIEGKTGAAMFALRTGVPVLPVFIQSPRGRFLKRVHVVIGEPFVPECDGKPTHDDYRRVADEIMEHIWELEEKVK
ncbi:MAG: 1-acyl-sn-glycerol-3-phosphate acyltransferase [Oscillospiraceae bacterium]|nr:1-acyl-sn-glycerol-3-phosphate acyltransferase [Oscillospiraceae bacterium]